MVELLGFWKVGHDRLRPGNELTILWLGAVSMRIRVSIIPMMLSTCCLLVAATISTGQQDAAKTSHVPEPAAPENQEYIGVTKCSACHFDQFQDWRKQQVKHAKAFDNVPAAYKNDATCLKCHTTGHGSPSGFKTAADRQLAGITCESCHGPGSTHAELSKPFAKKKDLAPEEAKIARDSIYRMLPENVCVTCHSARAHAKHPDYKKAG